jgi:ribose transport system substrate-binding protein
MEWFRRMAVVLGTTACVVGYGASSVLAQGTGSVEGNGQELVMFTITASNVYGANQIKGAQSEAEKLGYKLTVFQNNFSQPEQDQQVQQYIASGAKPAAIIFWPWVADAALNDVRQLSQIAPVIQLTQEPNERSWPYVQAYSGESVRRSAACSSRRAKRRREPAWNSRARAATCWSSSIQRERRPAPNA